MPDQQELLYEGENSRSLHCTVSTCSARATSAVSLEHFSGEPGWLENHDGTEEIASCNAPLLAPGGTEVLPNPRGHGGGRGSVGSVSERTSQKRQREQVWAATHPIRLNFPGGRSPGGNTWQLSSLPCNDGPGEGQRWSANAGIDVAKRLIARHRSYTWHWRYLSIAETFRRLWHCAMRGGGDEVLSSWTRYGCCY